MSARAHSTSHPDPTRPSLSPTLDLGPSPPRAPVRRNLFSAHLSRRPASTQTSELPASHSTSNPQNQALPLFPPPQPSIAPASPFTSRPPQLHPSFSSGYDPTISPNRPISPKTSAALFPLPTSIIARDPTTGKPLLPQLPTLPRRLRLDDDDDGDDKGDDEEVDDDEIEDADDLDDRDQHPGHRKADSGSVQSQSHVASSNAQPYSQAGHDPFAAAPSSSHPPPAAAAPAPATVASSSSPGTLAYPATAAPTDRDEEALESQRHDAHIDGMMTRYRSRQYAKRTAHAKSAGSGRHPRAQSRHDGDEELEEEELMNHLKSALHREVCRAEEEAWMFGEIERSWVHSGGLDQDAGGMVMGGSAGVGTTYE